MAKSPPLSSSMRTYSVKRSVVARHPTHRRNRLDASTSCPSASIARLRIPQQPVGLRERDSEPPSGGRSGQRARKRPLTWGAGLTSPGAARQLRLHATDDGRDCWALRKVVFAILGVTVKAWAKRGRTWTRLAARSPLFGPSPPGCWCSALPSPAASARAATAKRCATPAPSPSPEAAPCHTTSSNKQKVSQLGLEPLAG